MTRQMSIEEVAEYLLGKFATHKTGGPSMVVRETRVQDVPHAVVWCTCVYWPMTSEVPVSFELAAHELDFEAPEPEEVE